MSAFFLLLLSSVSICAAVTEQFLAPSPSLLSDSGHLKLHIEADFAAVQAALNEAAQAVASSKGNIRHVEITLHGSRAVLNSAKSGINIPPALGSKDVQLTVQSDSSTALSAGVRLQNVDPEIQEHRLLRPLDKDGIREFSVDAQVSDECEEASGIFWPRSTCEGCMPADLFCQGRRLVRAQYPNRGSGRQQSWLHIQNVTLQGDSMVEIHLDPSELGSRERVDGWWKEVNSGWGNVWLHGAFFLPWADDFVRVASVMRFPHPSFIINTSHTPPQYDFKRDQRFVVVNALADLDEEGEFYMRGSSLFAILSASCLASDSLTLTHAAHVLTASTHLSNAVFRGLSFQHSRSAAVYFPHGASNVAFEQCSFSGTGTEGLRIENATSRNVAVRDSSFADTGCGGARVEGGDVRTLSGGGHVFDSCAFRQPSQAVMTYTPALGMTGVAHKAKRCSFDDMPHMALGKAESPSREIRIRNVQTACVGCRVTACAFRDIAHSTTDVGAIYFAYNVLTSVTVHGCSFANVRADRTTRTWGYRYAAAIYWDMGVSYGTIVGNTFENVDIGVIVNNGVEHSIEFNDFRNAMQAVYIIQPFARLELCKTYLEGPDSAFHKQLASVQFGAATAWQDTNPKLAFHLRGVNCSRAAATAVPRSTAVALNTFGNLSAGFHDCNASVLRGWGVLLHSNRPAPRAPRA